MLLTIEKLPLAFPPRAVTVAMQATMMRVNITAYSTAVGPSSFSRNFRDA